MFCDVEYDLAIQAQRNIFDTLEAAKQEMRLLTKEEIEQVETLLLLLSIYIKERT